MYFEFLFFRAHSRKRVERMYWSGWSLNSFTTCSNSVIVGTTGPMGSGLPQLGLPRLFAIVQFLPAFQSLHRDGAWIPSASRSSVYLIGFTILLQRLRAPFQSCYQGPPTGEGVPICPIERFPIYPDFSDISRKNVQLRALRPRICIGAGRPVYPPLNETDSSGKSNQSRRRRPLSGEKNGLAACG